MFEVLLRWKLSGSLCLFKRPRHPRCDSISIILNKRACKCALSLISYQLLGKSAVFIYKTIFIHLYYLSTELIVVLIWRCIDLQLIVQLCFTWRRRGKLCDSLQVYVFSLSLAFLAFLEIFFLNTSKDIFAHTRLLV